MPEMENTAEFYYEKLKTATDPGRILSALFSSLYSVETTRTIIIMCNKLIKVFGRFTLFFAILDMAGSYPDLTDNPYPLLYTICKRKFEAAHGDVFLQSHESLDSFLSSIDKELLQIQKKNKKKIDVPSSEGLA